jgi:hypothetical protein
MNAHYITCQCGLERKNNDKTHNFLKKHSKKIKIHEFTNIPDMFSTQNKIFIKRTTQLNIYKNNYTTDCQRLAWRCSIYKSIN